MNEAALPYPIIAVVAPLLFSFLIFVVGMWNRKVCYWLFLAALATSLYSAVVESAAVIQNGPMRYFLGGWEPPWGIELSIDHLSALMILLITSIALVVGVYSRKSVARELPGKDTAFYSLFLLFVAASLGIVLTGDMFNLYVFLEISALSGYALLSLGEDRAAYSAFKYVVLGTIGACFYLLGVGYLYISTGSLNMADLAQRLPELYQSRVVLVGFTFLLFGLAVKTAIFPLHSWLPDAYTHASSTASAITASLTTKVTAYVIIRVMYTVFEPHFTIEMLSTDAVLRWGASIAIVAGGVMALAQKDFKRMLAYIIVMEIGYIVLGVGMANESGLTGAILHIVNDAVMMACLFLIVGAVMYKTSIRDINAFRHLGKKMPYTTFALVIAGLSVIGIPPTCGFFSKWYLLLGAIDSGRWVFAAVLILSSMVSAVLIFRVIEQVFLVPRAGGHGAGHDEDEGGEIVRDEAPLSMIIPIYVTVAGIMILGPVSGKLISSLIRHAIPAGF